MINKPFTHAQVVKILDKVFSPDISVKLNSESNIYSYNSITRAGAEYLLYHALWGRNYDEVLSECGLTLEVID